MKEPLADNFKVNDSQNFFNKKCYFITNYQYLYLNIKHIIFFI